MLALLVSLFFSISSFACDFNPTVKNVYSLAGSVTLALRDLDLINNPRLRGVSIFHPVDKKIFKGEILPGGIFLSHDTIKNLKDSILFYDESLEMTRILSRYPSVKAVQVKTRSQTPMEVIKSTGELLAPFLQGCELSRLSKKLQSKLDILKSKHHHHKTMLFFLGTAVGNRLPEMLMVNDGVVKWMVNEKLIKTYPSPLAYVNWSSKIMQEIPKDSLKVAIKDSGSEMVSKIVKSGETINLTFPGALIPGSGQVEAMIYLFENL
jgi:hypothetical protein